MICIVNFNNSRNLSDIKYIFDNCGESSLEVLMNGFQQGTTYWSVPKNTMPGDEVIFMCAKSARDNRGEAYDELPAPKKKQ